MIKNIINKILRTKKDKYTPQVVNLYKLCEGDDKLHYYDQICNRIYREIEKDESLGDYVRIDSRDKSNMFFDENGIFMFSDIFMGYFSSEYIIKLWKYLNDLNELSHAKYEFEQTFKAITVPKLKKLLVIYTTNEMKYEEKTAQRLADRTRLELKNRKRIFQLYSKSN